MTDYKEIKEAVLKSESIDELRRKQCMPPVPKCESDQNYVFISYSHKDYKSVYCDLLEFHKAGLRYWYDEGLPAGEDWDKVVEGKIKSENCAGVIFYMSENLFLSRSINKEIEFTVNGGSDGNEGKNYFCVNIFGMSPTKILKQIIRTYDDDELEKFGIDDRMSDLLHAFSNKATYISKAADSDKGHINDTLKQIRDRFNVIADGCPVENNEEVLKLAAELELAKRFAVENGVLLRYMGDDTEVIIPDTVTAIGANAFENRENITTAVLPRTITNIRRNGFRGCINLKRINIPEGVTVIDDNAFEGCVSLTEIHLPDSIKLMGEGAFAKCVSLKEIEIPAGITTVETLLFYGCTSLEKVIFRGDKVTSLEQAAFAQCTALKGFNTPNSVLFIYSDVFKHCRGLESVYIPNVIRLYKEAFTGCLALTDITYNGTVEQWRSIDVVTGNYTVHCTDGSLKKQNDLPKEDRELLIQALETVVSENKVAVSLLQRKMNIGFIRAARLIDLMFSYGYVGEFDNETKRRPLYITREELEKLKQSK